MTTSLDTSERATAAMRPQCKSCGATTVRDLGPLPEPVPTFGGQPCPVSIAPGRLWRCMYCDLCFRFPCLTQAELTLLYKDLPDSVWSSGREGNAAWKEVRFLCEQFAPRKTILDVGCFAGDFLEQMPRDWIKLGVEPSRAAQNKAELRGIRIMAQSMESIDPRESRAGVITLLDVIEHFERPFALLQKAAALLEPKGCIILLTGATDSLPFQLLGNHYWYCSLPEHISFTSRKWFEWSARRLDMSLRYWRVITTEPSPLLPWFRNGLRAVSYSIAASIREAGRDTRFARMIPGLERALTWHHPPWWKNARDHSLVILQRRHH